MFEKKAGKSEDMAPVVGRKSVVMTCLAVVLFGAAACGDEAGAEPLSKSQISRAVLSQGDVPGYNFFDESRAETDKSARADKKACQPIVAFAIAPEMSAYDKRSARQRITKSEKPDADYQLILTSAESEAAAQDALKDLKSAVTACSSGFNLTYSGQTNKVRRVTSDKTSSGSQINILFEYQAGMKIRYVVMREGATLVRISAATRYANEFVTVPKRISEKQFQKLRKVAE
ncbi:hypothetical protein [Streptomyces dioscori]|uniref:hypothetical protein n=1 Tax=Streptomyces dioscori TaxID=2109333 RepID=UPI00131BBF74|nr:hypothetical protein [Streptomyces dioscori]